MSVHGLHIQLASVPSRSLKLQVWLDRLRVGTCFWAALRIWYNLYTRFGCHYPMLTLRLTQVAEGSDQHRVELALEGDGPRHTAVSHFKFSVSEQDREDVRWYLEDYLQYPLDPAPKIAERIEERMAEIGGELFQSIFQS